MDDMKCGHCGRTWNSEELPTPAGRCPYEYEHEYAIEAQPAPMRYALVREQAGMTDQIASYLPANYRVIGRTPIRGTNRVEILIGGSDVAGWTLDEYVIPRLASGLIFAEEIA